MLHGGTKFRQGLLQLMIHSIDPLYEEPITMALTNGQELSKNHVHPPGAPFCPICGEDKHQVKIDSTYGNGELFHMTDIEGDKIFKSTRNGDLARQPTVRGFYLEKK